MKKRHFCTMMKGGGNNLLLICLLELFVSCADVGHESETQSQEKHVEIYTSSSGFHYAKDERSVSVYGLDEIPEEVRGAGFSGVNRYAALDGMKLDGLKKSVVRVDVLLKRACIQSKSYDEVETVASEAGDRNSHIPAICPISTDPKTYHLSSPFGYRSDPMRGYRKFHSGTVIKAEHDFFGYGNNIIISHGFGYKTRYAHLKSIEVEVGEKVVRGQRIALTGNTGRSTGPHLHYEIIYRNEHVNPYGFMDLTIPAEEYEAILSSAAVDMETGEGAGS